MTYNWHYIQTLLIGTTYWYWKRYTHRMRSGEKSLLRTSSGPKGIILLVSVAGEKCTAHIFTVGAGYTLCVPFERDTSDKEGGMNALLVLPSRTLQTLASL